MVFALTGPCHFFFFVFVNMGPYESQSFKTLHLHQITFEFFQFFSELYSQWSSHKYCFALLKFLSLRFFTFFFVFVNMGPDWSQNVKMPLLPQFTFESFQTFPEILSF